MARARLAVVALAVVLLGAGLTPAHIEPSTLHVRWTIRYHDLVATGDFDVRQTNDSVVNVFPAAMRRASAEMHPHLRIVVARRTVFERDLTPSEARRLGGLEVLHVASDVRGTGDRDLAAGAQTILQYRGPLHGYRFVRVSPARDFGEGSFLMNCPRKGSFVSERTAAYAGEVVHVVQRGGQWDCLYRFANIAEVTIASRGTIVYRSRAAITHRGKVTPAGAVGNLRVIDGPAFVDFERTGRPSIVLSGTSGGMHCCFRTHVFYRTGSHAYAQAVREWGNSYSYPALVLDLRSGEVVFVSSNDAFAWLFTGYAHAFEPAQVLAFEHGRFLDVTPEFSGVIEEQAGRIWRTAVRLRHDGEIATFQSAISAYLADMAILGRSAEGWRNAKRLCSAPACAPYLRDVAARLRELHYPGPDR